MSSQARRTEPEAHVPERDPARGRASTEPGGGTDRSMAVMRLQGTVGNAAVAALLARTGDADHSGRTGPEISTLLAVQRKPKKPKPAPPKPPPSTDPPQKQLADIQGHAMPTLLPKIAALEVPVRTDFALGEAVGSTRMKLAMLAVDHKLKGGKSDAFVAARKADFMAWPPDQMGEILEYLGASPKGAIQDLAVAELPEIVEDKEQQFPMAPKGRADLIKTTAGQMFKTMGHATTALFIQDVKQRVSVALYMQGTQGGKIVDGHLAKGFSYPNRASDGTVGKPAQVNVAAAGLWGPNVKGDNYEFPLSDIGRLDAYAAITALFTPQTNPHDRTLIHCDYLVSIIEYRAWAQTIGIDVFNENVKNKNLEVVLAYDGFARLAKPIDLAKGGKSETFRPLVETAVASEADLIVGDHVVFYNDPTYEALTVGSPDVWKLENAIVVATDANGLLYQGHGYSSPVAKSVMMDSMCAKYNTHVDRVLALIKTEATAKSKAAREAAAKTHAEKYPNVKRSSSGGWEVVGNSSVTGNTERRALGYLTPKTAPGLLKPGSFSIMARRPVHD